MLRRTLITIMLAGLATVAAAESVYKWIDTSGQVHYTDRPPTESGAKLLGVFEREQLLATGEEAGGEDTAPDTYDAGPALEEAQGDQAAAAVQRDLDQARSEQCKQAQERYKTYIESRRLYRETTDGKREYLTDAELAAARIEAKKAVDDLCQ
jgi:hypothetical protein